MTIGTTSPFIEYNYTSDGTFSFSFPTDSETELTVKHIPSGGSEVTLILNTDYSVLLNADGTGNITTTFSGTSGKLQIRRVIPISQTTDLINGEKFDLESIEKIFDRVFMVLQQQSVELQQGDYSFKGKGTWTANTAYSIGDFVKHPTLTTWYLCTLAHTSGASFEITNWQLGFDLSEFYPISQDVILQVTSPTSGQILTYDGTKFINSNQIIDTSLGSVGQVVKKGTGGLEFQDESVYDDSSVKNRYHFEAKDWHHIEDTTEANRVLNETINNVAGATFEDTSRILHVFNIHAPANKQLNVRIDHASKVASSGTKNRKFRIRIADYHTNVQIDQSDTETDAEFDDVSVPVTTNRSSTTLTGVLENDRISTETRIRIEVLVEAATTNNHPENIHISDLYLTWV